MKKIVWSLIAVLILFFLTSCGVPDSNFDKGFLEHESYNDESYLEINENPFVDVLKNPSSYFSLDNSTAGYANLRRMINSEVSYINPNAVKIEEMINYFTYDYESPTDDVLNISAGMIDTPWNEETKLVTIGVKAMEVDLTNKKPTNIVLLLDVSGSMSAPNKLPLLQSAFKLFVESLDDNDVISIVTYASGDQVLLNGARGYEKTRIMAVIEDLEAGGSTAGAKGIQTAYEIAKENFIPNGHNRVIIGTDGDFNVGISSTNELKNFISEKRDEEKIYLSVLGFGYGNLKDDKLETLANSGNGTYAYIDSITEAKKVLIEEMGGTLNIVSKDTKTKVTFNPKYVKSYRQIGYENKKLTKEEYEDESTDAGEIGAGHMATAVYEIILNTDDDIESTMDSSWFNVEISFKDPETDESKVIQKFFNDKSKLSNNSEDIYFISAVVEFGLILRDSAYKADADLNSLIARIQDMNSVKNNVYKKEFRELLLKYRNIISEK